MGPSETILAIVVGYMIGRFLAKITGPLIIEWLERKGWL